MEKRVVITLEGKDIHLVLGNTNDEWEEMFGEIDDLWDFPLEELLDGTVEPNEDIWYWYFDGRCYETDIEV